MNVMFLNAIEKNTFGGVEYWMVRTAAALAGRGHRVWAVGRPGSKYLRRARDAEYDVGTIELAISGDFNPVTIYRMRRILKENEIDALFVSCNKDLRLGGLAARWCGKTKVFWRIGVDLTKNNTVHRRLTPKLLDGVITASQALKDEIIRTGYLKENMITVIPNGVNAYRINPYNPESKKQLREKYRLPGDCRIAVSSARFVPEKGHRFLIAAAAELAVRYPDLYFLLLGDGPLENELKEQIKELKLEPKFVFAGHLADFTLEMVGADLMIHPSTAESFGIALLDGMRAKLPVAASAVGGIGEVVSDRETGVLFEPGKPEAIVRAVSDLLDSTEKMRRYAEAGYRRWQEHFSFEKMIERIEYYIRRYAA
ncbi:MAG: glycosyltransferase [Candidatus Zixiibacteriota bacterium]